MMSMSWSSGPILCSICITFAGSGDPVISMKVFMTRTGDGSAGVPLVKNQNSKINRWLKWIGDWKCLRPVRPVWPRKRQPTPYNPQGLANRSNPFVSTASKPLFGQRIHSNLCVCVILQTTGHANLLCFVSTTWSLHACTCPWVQWLESYTPPWRCSNFWCCPHLL